MMSAESGLTLLFDTPLCDDMTKFMRLCYDNKYAAYPKSTVPKPEITIV
jgi:hypothetical protein